MGRTRRVQGHAALLPGRRLGQARCSAYGQIKSSSVLGVVCAHGLRGQGMRARHGQGVFNGVAHGLVDLAAVAKTHLNFGRVHIHIDPGRVHLHIQRVHRLALAVQHVFVGAARTVGQDLVAHKAAVHIGKLVVRPRAGGVGHTGAPGDVHRANAVADGHRLRHKIFAQHIGQPLFQTGRAGVVAPLLDQLAFVPNGKAHVGPGQGMAAHGLDAVRQLGAVGFEKFSPRRG